MHSKWQRGVTRGLDDMTNGVDDKTSSANNMTNGVAGTTNGADDMASSVNNMTNSAAGMTNGADDMTNVVAVGGRVPHSDRFPQCHHHLSQVSCLSRSAPPPPVGLLAACLAQ